MISFSDSATVIFAFTTPLFLNTKGVVASSLLTDQCKQETEALQANEDVSLAFEELLNEYKDDDESVCDFSSTGVDCGVDISSQNETFSAVCLEAGGQIIDRKVGFNCRIARVARFDIGIGEVPICVGISCNITGLEVTDFNNTRVDNFLDDVCTCAGISLLHLNSPRDKPR